MSARRGSLPSGRCGASRRRAAPCARVAADCRLMLQVKPAASVAVDTLPTKAADGSWVYKSAEATHPKPGAAAVAVTKGKRAREVPDGAEPGGAASSAKRQQAAGGLAEQPTASNAALAFDQLQEQELSIAQKKERIAAACAALLEAPERNVSELKVRHRLLACC